MIHEVYDDENGNYNKIYGCGVGLRGETQRLVSLSFLEYLKLPREQWKRERYSTREYTPLYKSLVLLALKVVIVERFGFSFYMVAVITVVISH